jgi:hypothetical protein
MVDQNMARAIANVAIFLEFSNEDLINEDASVEAMEQLAADLQAMDGSARAALSKALKEIAQSYDSGTSQFVAELPEYFGIE